MQRQQRSPMLAGKPSRSRPDSWACGRQGGSEEATLMSLYRRSHGGHELPSRARLPSHAAAAAHRFGPAGTSLAVELHTLQQQLPFQEQATHRPLIASCTMFLNSALLTRPPLRAFTSSMMSSMSSICRWHWKRTARVCQIDCFCVRRLGHIAQQARGSLCTKASLYLCESPHELRCLLLRWSMGRSRTERLSCTPVHPRGT